LVRMQSMKKEANPQFSNTWYPALARFSGISFGTRLLRFAYTPMDPSLIEAAWTTVPEAGCLSATNFWGGLLGMGAEILSRGVAYPIIFWTAKRLMA
jgi:hypothetical protein